MIIQYILFTILAIIFFVLPGMVLKKLISGSFPVNLEGLLFSTIIGYAQITLITYFALILRIGFIAVILIIFASFFIYKKDFKKINIRKLIPKLDLKILIVLILGVIFQTLVIAPSGIIQNGDLLFWSSHGHDAAWHIAVMNKIASGFPLENPVFAGEKLVNYHYFFNIMPAMFMKYFSLSPFEMYFRLFPLLFSLLLGGSSYYLGKKLGKSIGAGLWSMFFVLFAGSFGYIATLLKNGTVGGESIFYATQPHSSIGNPPQIISNFMFLTFLYFLYDYLKKNSKYSYVSCILIAGVLALFKVYAAIALLLPLGVLAIYRFIKERNVDLFKMTFFSGILSALLYLPNTANSTGFLIFEPWWYIRTMVVLDSRLDWIDMELRRQTFLAENNYLRVFQLELTAFVIFLIGNLGTRILGTMYFLKDINKLLKDYYHLLLIIIAFFSVLLPLLFLQKGVVSNTAQFLQYYVLIFSLVSAPIVKNFLSKLKDRSLKYIIVILFIILSIPTQIGLLYEFYKRPAFAKISREELQALTYIKDNTPENSIVLVPPYDPDYSTNDNTPEIWDWFDTSYVSAFSDRSVYFADFEQMDIMGYEIGNRQDTVKAIFDTTSTEEFEELVMDTNTNYIYFHKLQAPKIRPEYTRFNKVYSNEAVEIWKI